MHFYYVIMYMLYRGTLHIYMYSVDENTPTISLFNYSETLLQILLEFSRQKV